MAVYEQTYRPYEGKLTPAWSRFLVLPRYAYRSVFASKIFVALFAVCFIYPLVASILIYLHHNTNAMAILQTTVGDLVPIDRDFFHNFVFAQAMLGFFLNILIGPPLISRDLANNALPLYLCRPFSRAEYVLGKMSVILILLSMITWIPGLLLFLFQSYLEGASWFVQNLRIAGAILVGSLVWIFMLALLSLAVSAWVRWRMAASAALLGIFFIPSAFAGLINNLFDTRWGNLISLRAVISAVWAGLFGTFVRQVRDVQEFRNGRVIREVILTEPPLWGAWTVLLLICLISLVLLVRKLRAYEVV